jgi:SAM-dependent methyltransferase
MSEERRAMPVPTLRERAADSLRYYARKTMYASSLSASLVRSVAPLLSKGDRPDRPDYFQGKRLTYLQPTFSVLARDALTGALLQRIAPSVRSVWDIGCGRGSLAGVLRPLGCTWYQGDDINPVAIKEAAEACAAAPDSYPAHVQFREDGMGSCRPMREDPVDVVVFNEVLYYLPSTRDAAVELSRVAKWMSPKGILCLSLKDDPKSHAVLRIVPKEFAFIQSVLFQEQAGRPSFRVRIDRQRPGYLISTFERLPRSML